MDRVGPLRPLAEIVGSMVAVATLAEPVLYSTGLFNLCPGHPFATRNLCGLSN